MKRSGNRVLAIALDAAEPALIERGIEDGWLPRLKQLRDRGAWGRMISSAKWLAGSPWPTFYTGRDPSHHGFYHCLQWDPRGMTLIRPGSPNLNPRPFWRDLGAAGRHAVALDMPMALPPSPFDGLEVAGWGTHDQLAPPASHPSELLTEIRRKFGDPPLGEESFAPQLLSELADLRDELIQTTERTVLAAEMLLARERWDLFLVAFSAPHRGGHRLWDRTGVRDAPDSEAEMTCQRALRDLYVACDTAVGRLLDAANSDVYHLVFSLHGMGSNTSRVDLLPDMLDRILDPPKAAAKKPRAPSRRIAFSRFFPESFRDAIKQRLPQSMRDRITTYYRMGQTNWSQTKAFSLVADLQGYIRVNLRGREVAGIVAPSEHDDLCQQIGEGLASFVDADTREPIVDEVLRTDTLFDGGPRGHELPDLIVQWSATPAAEHRAVKSPTFGTIPWPTPNKMPDGRGGNHRPDGFLLAAGPGIEARSVIAGADILNLAPTIHGLLGISIPQPMRAPIPSLIKPREITG